MQLIAKFESPLSSITRFIYLPESTLVDIMNMPFAFFRVRTSWSSQRWLFLSFFILFSAAIHFGQTCIQNACFLCKCLPLCLWELIATLRLCLASCNIPVLRWQHLVHNTLCEPLAWPRMNRGSGLKNVRLFKQALCAGRSLNCFKGNWAQSKQVWKLFVL